MAKLNKNLIKELSSFTGEYCISLYLPTHRYGEEVKNGKDTIVYKNALIKVKDQLKEAGAAPRKIESVMAPFQSLLEDPIFWNNQREGLAVFAGEDFFEPVRLNTSVSKIQWVSDHFLLTPLIALLEPKWEFYILTLDLDNVALYHATNTDIENITGQHPDLPNKIKDVINEDDRSTGLQFRTQQSGSGKAIYHGHGGGKEDKKQEIFQFFREINESLIRFFESNNKPLVIFSQDYLFPIYKEANGYRNLSKDYINKHPAGFKDVDIHDKAWSLMKPLYFKERESKIQYFNQVHGSGKTSTEIETIVRTARQGRVDTLIIAENIDVFGYYDQNKDEVIVKETTWPKNYSLINDAAIHTFLSDGNVFQLNQNDMPDKTKPVNVLLRY